MLVRNIKFIYQMFFLIIAVSSIFSCASEESIPVTADFSINVVNDDYSVPVRIEVFNKSRGADTYYWDFEGAVKTTSNKKSPKPVVYTQPGTYKIRLKASNRDGNVDIKEIDIKIDAAMKADFDWEMQGSEISPVTLQMMDKSKGAIDYLWEFEGGNPTTSTNQAPKVIFSSAGEHLIKLTISNGRETYSKEKTVTVQPAMTIGFDWSVDFIDHDYQAPVVLYMNNLSTNAFTYKWIVQGANPSVSTEKKPDFQFTNPGTYTIILQVTNDKETKTLEKQVTIYPDTNLLIFNDIKLGINTAHTSIGCFFSSELGSVIKKDEVSDTPGGKIDFGFFGLNSSFNYNQFLSPDEVQTTSFGAIPNAIHTKIINSQELVGVQLNPSEFDIIKKGNDLNLITITETNVGNTPFNHIQSPRIILFQMEDGRKGAIKVKDFVSVGLDSYILVDIKVQKQSE